MKPYLLLAAAPLLVAATPEEELRKDVRCFAAMGMLVQHEDETVRNAALMAAQYYLGRIDGRAPSADLEDLLAREAPSLAGQDNAALMRACGALLQTRGAAVVAVGNKLKARGF